MKITYTLSDDERADIVAKLKLDNPLGSNPTDTDVDAFTQRFFAHKLKDVALELEQRSAELPGRDAAARQLTRTAIDAYVETARADKVRRDLEEAAAAVAEPVDDGKTAPATLEQERGGRASRLEGTDGD